MSPTPEQVAEAREVAERIARNDCVAIATPAEVKAAMRVFLTVGAPVATIKPPADMVEELTILGIQAGCATFGAKFGHEEWTILDDINRRGALAHTRAVLSALARRGVKALPSVDTLAAELFGAHEVASGGARCWAFPWQNGGPNDQERAFAKAQARTLVARLSPILAAKDHEIATLQQERDGAIASRDAKWAAAKRLAADETARAERAEAGRAVMQALLVEKHGLAVLNEIRSRLSEGAEASK
jgi:hypothetical protein